MTLGEVGAQSAPVAWLNKGWESLKAYAHDAITHYRERKEDEHALPDEAAFPGAWGIVAVDVTDHESHLQARFEIPGLAKADLAVVIDGARLSVTGEKRMSRNREQGGCHIAERAFGHFERSVTLPASVDAERASAKYQDGVLIVDLPKRAVPKGGRVAVA